MLVYTYILGEKNIFEIINHVTIEIDGYLSKGV